MNNTAIKTMKIKLIKSDTVTSKGVPIPIKKPINEDATVLTHF